MAKNFRFHDWSVYKESKEIVTIIMKLVQHLPAQYRFEFGNQILRSSLSIVLNIAEGSGKGTDKDFNRFLSIALGSVNETFAAIDVFRENGLITNEEFQDVSKKLESVSNQLGGFKKKLKKS